MPMQHLDFFFKTIDHSQCRRKDDKSLFTILSRMWNESLRISVKNDRKIKMSISILEVKNE